MTPPIMIFRYALLWIDLFAFFRLSKATFRKTARPRDISLAERVKRNLSASLVSCTSPTPPLTSRTLSDQRRTRAPIRPAHLTASPSPGGLRLARTLESRSPAEEEVAP